MTTPSSTSNLAPLQPPNLYHLSPTYQKWCALRCADIITLKDRKVYVEGKLIHHYLNHPIRYIKLLGLIVSIDDFAHRRVYTIDDSSGACIECVALLPSRNAPAPSTAPAPPSQQPPEPSIEHPQIQWDDMEECKIVRILGVMGTYMTMPQIQIIKMGIVGSTELERKWWDECARLKLEVLEREWRVSCAEVARWERRERRRGERERGRERGREGERKIKEGDRGKRRKRDTRTSDDLAKENPHLPTQQQEENRPVIPKRKEPPNPKPKDPHHLLEIATHPPTSTSISNPPKSTSNPKPEPPPKKRIIPVTLTHLAKFDTFAAADLGLGNIIIILGLIGDESLANGSMFSFGRSGGFLGYLLWGRCTKVFRWVTLRSGVYISIPRFVVRTFYDLEISRCPSRYTHTHSRISLEGFIKLNASHYSQGIIYTGDSSAAP
ncbi:hypothetical protein EYC80_000228 [Monilinia laxa]|uniref:CST complex subunit Stn1 N-terminal domain-containing protein n=1 Tax=Monilinia laxa TaxID=61186 RepID=A0A5N6K9W9_MONLA|nr:hypothetical protein EYC80_000228 [Monilinia laxa]